ncbi:MAG: 5'-nucleotidase C-terminal domain-containing protein [Saprospiraceae bacterium]|nr:5'-nucleotidase C-terminal domain-containing protein [Saprospiraceae bacterium]
MYHKGKLIFAVLLATLLSCHKTQTYYSYHEARTYRIDERSRAEDTAVVRIIQPYKNALDGKMNEVVGYNAAELVKGKPSSTMTNWMADGVREGYEIISGKKVDVALQNYGGIRINSLAAGDITVGKMYEVMPFENYLVVMECSGEVLLKLLNRVALYGGWPISRGSGFVMRDSMAAAVVINQKPLDLQATYTLALPDYVANGGDDCSFLKDLPREDTGLLVRDILIAYVRNKKIIQPDNETRISQLK